MWTIAYYVMVPQSREEALRLQLRRAGYRKDLSQEEVSLPACFAHPIH